MSRETYHFVIEENSRNQIDFYAVKCGDDYHVSLCGGTRYHGGAVALGCDESYLEGHEERGATVSVLCAFGHRDDEAARWAAKYLATNLKCNVCVSAGIHVEAADKEDIRNLLKNCREACERFLSECLKGQANE